MLDPLTKPAMDNLDPNGERLQGGASWTAAVCFCVLLLPLQATPRLSLLLTLLTLLLQAALLPSWTWTTLPAWRATALAPK